MVIKYKGEVLKTSHYDSSITDEECDKIRESYFKKPSLHQVQRQILSLDKGGVPLGCIYSYQSFGW